MTGADRNPEGLFGWRRALGRAGLVLAALPFLGVAAGLLLAAAWMEIAAHSDPVLASLALAAACAAAGLALLGLAWARGRRRRPPQPASDADAALRALFAEAGLRVPERGESPPLVAAFLFGLTMALRLGRR